MLWDWQLMEYAYFIQKGEVARRNDVTQQSVIPVTSVTTHFISPQIPSGLMIQCKMTIDVDWELSFKWKWEKTVSFLFLFNP